MDACARIRGVPVRSRAAVRKETVRDGGAQSVKSLLRNRKELCGVGHEPPARDAGRLTTEVHFVCLPGQSDGDDVTQQALSCLPVGLCELLRSLHVHGLKNDEVLLLKDLRRLVELKDGGPQCWLKAVCVLRHNPGPGGGGGGPQVGVASLVGLLGCYVAGVRYALELQALQRGAAEAGQPEEDDTNQSVSSIEDDFVTALEHLEEDEAGDGASPYCHFKKRDVASQTIPAHRRKKELSGSRILVGSSQRKSSARPKSGADVSVTVQRSSAAESQWTYCSPGARPPPSPAAAAASESEDSDCSSPSPIIFLDEVGYQKSLRAKLDIPQVPGGPRERVEDSDSEVSEFFDSFDQFDDLDEPSEESCTLTLPLDAAQAPAGGSASKYVSRGCSTKGMNPQRFEQPTLPADVKKPTPLKPGSPYSLASDVPDSPRPVQTPSEENAGPLFSPLSSSAFSPLVDSAGPLEYFWKTEEEEEEGEEDGPELRKPQDLCSLYKTYSDFAGSLSREILGSVCGYQAAVDFSHNRNLSCVCHKEFANAAGHLMKLSDIQEAVTVAGLQRTSQSLKDGIQRFASDLVEMSLGSALRDLQKGVSSCTTTLCHLAARLTSSVFQMAFHEIGMRRAYVLKERAINGLAGFLVGEAVSGALKEFLAVKKQIFHGTVTRFAADLAEELVFEGMMEVCQFSHPSTPLTPSDWSFGQVKEEVEEEEEEEEEVVCSYASDLSESVLQEAFIELSQADVAFTSQAAISVSLDNVCYVSAQSAGARTCSTFANQQVLSSSSAGAGAVGAGPSSSGEEPSCTVKKALFSVSGMASCIPVPQAGQALSHLQDPEEAALQASAGTPPAPPPPDAVTQTLLSHGTQTAVAPEDSAQGKPAFQSFSGNMVDLLVSEACELITASKVKKSFGDCADFLTKTIGSRRDSASTSDAPDSPLRRGERPVTSQTGSPSRGGAGGAGVAEARHAVTMDTLSVPGAEPAAGGQRRSPAPADEAAPSPGQRSGGTPGTPPSTPQQPSEVSRERQIRQFSKRLKSKLAEEFSPATPPPTPHRQPEPGPPPQGSAPDADKAEFMLKLMRSLSEEADGGEEEEEEEEEEGGGGGGGPSPSAGRHERGEAASRRASSKEALHYAERLACHIVSMATEMDTLGGTEGAELSEGGGGGGRRDSVAQFSEQTLNTLWVYAGEVAGEVIDDVKRMVGAGQRCPHHHHPHPHHHHRAPRRRSLDKPGAEGRQQKAGRLPEHGANDLVASVSRPPGPAPGTGSAPGTGPAPSSGSAPGLSSQYPSCESVTDEYAGYLIRVLKKEGGSRELVLDQYASRLAYRSIKLGLAHASRRVKQRSAGAASGARLLHASKSLPDEWGEPADPGPRPPPEEARCGCRSAEEQGRRDYVDLVNFAESLAFNVTRDVTRQLRVAPARLPKSLTDSCLYRASRPEEATGGGAGRSSAPCPLAAKEGRSRHYHSTGSLYDGGGVGGGGRAMQVIEHYAKKIVDDTLKMSLASAGPPPPRGHARRLSEGPYCGAAGRRRYPAPPPAPLLLQRRTKPGADSRGERRLSGLEIPQIHIDLDHRAALAEEMVSMAMETAKRELSNTSLNADSGIGHDGASYAESLTAEIMTSALSNACQTAGASSPGRETTESTVSQQLSVGDDSLGSWSNLSFEDEHPDDNSSFLHLSDSSNGNSSSWSSLGLEGDAGEPGEERLSFSPSDSSDNPEEKEAELREESSGTLCVDRTLTLAARTPLVIVNSDVREPGRGPQHAAPDPQLRSLLQWAAASMADVPQIQLSPDRELQQLPAVVQRLRERRWRVGELLHTLLRYCEESQPHGPPPPASAPPAPPGEEPQQAGREPHRVPLFQWLLEHA